MKNAMVEAPPPGSRWRFISEAMTGRLSVVRVMGTVEGWIVARRTGCIPFLIHVNDWRKRLEPIERKGKQ